MIASKLTKSNPTTSSEVRLVEVLDAYMAAAQEGRAPAREELLAEHPELAEDLEACLASLEFIQRASLAAPPMVLDSLSAEAGEGEPGIGDLGDFTLVAEIGRGGMGVVYEAVQRSLNRRVALKVLPFAAAMDPTQLRRFQTEALAAAQLHHTHIVPVYSVGCERGVHYYAMQFIEGQTLAQAIAERRLSERPPPPLVRRGSPYRAETADRRSPKPSATVNLATPSPSSRSKDYFRTAAALGIQAAEALDHAHKVGIVHRDVKPANLLLDVQGTLWVTDFGLARLRDDAGLTITGDLLGTLRYMSPEQALAKRILIDHRTDIYSLGATLYELVTLQPAIDGQDRQEVLRNIAHEEPAPPRRLNPLVPRELETILLKSMSKEPESRYDTAQELADDLRRFLESKPVKAKRPTIWEQTVKWGRRHPSIVASSFVTLMMAVVMLSATIIVVSWERKATKQALGLLAKQERAALRSANEATTQARLAEQSAWWVTQGITEPLKKLANPDLAKDPIFAEARQDVLNEAVLVYEQFLKFLAGRPGEEREDEGTLIHIALLHTIADDHPKAQAAYARAIEAAERRTRELPGIAVSEWLVAQTHSHLGMELWDVGNHADSRPHFRKAREAFRRAVALEPNEIRVINSAAWFLSFFQDAQYRDPETALVLARRLVTLTSERESNRLHLTAGFRSFFTLGLAEYRVANYGEARRALERSMNLRDGGDAYEWFVMAMILARQGEPARARKLHEEAVRWMRRFRYSDFELHFLDDEARALIGATDHSQSNNKKEEHTAQHSKP